MEATDTLPTFILFAFQGCNAPGLFADPWSAEPVLNEVRPVTVPLVLLIIAAVSMLLALVLWWREVSKGIPMALIGIALVGTLGFLGYQINDVYVNTPSFETFLTGGNYFISVGEFSFYLTVIAIMIIASLVLVAREIGWEAERNVLGLTTFAVVGMAVCWVFFSFAVWECI